MNREKLKTLIANKRERNNRLQVQTQYLEILEEELSRTKIKRFFGTSYLILKRFSLIFFSILLLILGAFTYLNPDWVYENTEIDNYLIDNTQKYYQEIAGETLKESLYNLSINESELTPDSIINSIKFGINNTIENEVYQTIIGLSILSIILSLLLLYLSRLTKKIRIRNKQISTAEGKIEKILVEFKDIINSEKGELKELEDIYNHKIVGSESYN